MSEFRSIRHFISTALWRWKIVVFTIFLVGVGASIFIYTVITPRYEAETLLLVGNGLKELSSSDDKPALNPSGLNTLAEIAETEDVLRDAAMKVGLDRLVPNLDDLPNEIDFVFSALLKSLSIKAMSRTDLLKVRFRHPNPTIAAEFANALAELLVAKHAGLLSVPGAELFFGMQTSRLEDEVQKAAARLEKYSTEFSIYSVYEQRTLLLKRESEIAEKLIKARGTVAEKNGQKRALTEQLQELTPVKKNPLISNVVRTFGATSEARSENYAGKSQSREQFFFNDPPLLLVRVYQDAMVELFKANADVEAAVNLVENLGQELKIVKQELETLASRAAKFERLDRDYKTAVAAARTYAKRLIEEQTSLGLAQARLSSVKIAQRASLPKHPASPRLILLLPLGLVGGIALGSAAAILLQAWAEPHAFGDALRSLGDVGGGLEVAGNQLEFAKKGQVRNTALKAPHGAPNLC